MRATTIIALALAAAPVLGGDYQHKCEYLSKTDNGATPDKLKFRCERLGGKETVCTELTLSECIGVGVLFGQLQSKG